MRRGLWDWETFLTLTGLSCVEFDETDYTPRYVVSKKKFVYPGALVTLLCVLELLVAFEFPAHPLQMSAFMPSMMVFFAVAVLISSWSSSTEYAGLKTTFLSFDNVITVDFKKIRVTALKWVFVMTLIYVLSFLAGYYYPLVYQGYAMFNQFAPIMAIYVGEVYSCVTTMHFIFCLFMIRKSFRLVNRRLEKLTNIENPSKMFGIQAFLRESVFQDSWELDTVKLRENDIMGTPESRIRTLRSLYHRTYVLTRQVNTFFSTRNTLTVGLNLILITATIYAGLKNIVFKINGNIDIHFLEVVNYFKWSVLSTISLFMMIMPCTWIYNETSKTSVIVQGMLTKDFSKEMKEELNSLAAQLVNEQVVFSPHDLFLLNNKLLLSMLGSLISYLIVLVQFQIRT